MNIVVDASVVVVALAGSGDEQRSVHRWLVDLSGGDRLHIVRSFTQLEFLSAIRKLAATRQLSDAAAHRAQQQFIEFPCQRADITNNMAQRIWEMRHNLTAYDAAYVALAERVQAEQRAACVVATDDRKFSNAPALPVGVERFPR